jgi:hypothetical protein
MMWCLKIMAREVDMKDVGVWQAVVVQGYVPSYSWVVSVLWRCVCWIYILT